MAAGGTTIPHPQEPARTAAIVLLVLMVAATAARLAIIDRPFIANSESLATGWVLSSSRNYARYGPFISRGAGVLNSGVVTPDRWIVYSHHPPLTPWLSAGAMWIGGVSERTGRIVPAAFSLATTALLFVFVRRRYGLAVAAATGFIYAFCPMTLALGDMAEYLNAPLVFCGVATVAAYVRWIETRKAAWLWTMSLAFLMGALSDWPIFYLAPILGAHAFFTRRATLAQAAAFGVASVGLFAALAWWVLWSGGDVSVFHQLSVRASPGDITVRGWIERVIIHHQGRLHTWPVLFLSGVYVLWAARERLTGRWRNLDAQLFPLLLLAWGLVHLFVGIDGNYRHEWWSLILTPAFALTAALGLQVLAGALPAWLRAPRVAAPATLAMAILFAAWSAYAAHAFTMRTWLGDSGYTLEGIGKAVHGAAADTEGVLTSIDTDHPALWFYADRQLRPAIRSVEALEAALDAGPYVVFYDYLQRDGPAPTWFVMPRAHRGRFADLAAALDARYPRRHIADAIVYRLRR